MIRPATNNLHAAEPALGPHAAFDFNAFAAEYGGTSIVRMNAGAVIYRQGEPVDNLFYLREGRVRITVVSAEGKAGHHGHP